MPSGWVSEISPEVAGLAARLPASLEPLARLAFNYRWSWLPGAREAFCEIDEHRWQVCAGNPLRFLQEVSSRALTRASRDRALMARFESLYAELRADLERPFSDRWPDPSRPIAFLCAEYGIHGSLPMYAGGLGVLAGDLLKEASDEAIPMVAVGLMYRQGYLHQQLDRSGWQREHWLESDAERLPAMLVTDEGGHPVTVFVDVGGHDVVLQIWRVDVGRIPLYLLDADRPENDRVDRWITGRVYVGDRRIRLAQYVVLGTGGIRALRALGIEPGVVHLNEGHAALAPLELARERVERGEPVDDALAEARERTVFTTHTPVAAGNEAYDRVELAAVLDGYPQRLGMDTEQLLRLGRVRPSDDGEPFGLTPLALRMSRATNAVSRLHGHTARAMWRPMFGDAAADEVPIRHVTNGVHLPTWMGAAMRELLDLHLGSGWQARTSEAALWDVFDQIPDEEIWSVRNRLRAELVAYVRDRSVADRLARGEPADYAEAAAREFDPAVLTVGFARRAAAYKRLSLLAHEPERVARLLSGEQRVQFVLAGKSHPQDEEAKQIVQAVFRLKDEPRAAERVAFLEDYDMAMSAQLVAGCDVWLNVPRYPLEASGTSGMKSALNGGLNVSVLDGWWAEAYDERAGWGIASDAALDAEVQDSRDANALYDVMEHEVVPMFYRRDADGIPREWLARVKASVRRVGEHFTATRMLGGYLDSMYRA